MEGDHGDWGSCMRSGNDLQQFYTMGNEQVKNQRQTLRRRAYNKTIQQESNNKKSHPLSLNRSLQNPSSAEPRQQYHSIDYGSIPSEDVNSIRSQRQHNRESTQRDQILSKLSQKNQQLRKQLKKISDQLTQQLKHKKFVPKKKAALDDDDEKQDKIANTAGLKRELQNGYKQIEMYKRTIAVLGGKEENDGSDIRVKRLENTISSTDAEINDYIKKVEGLKKVTKVQNQVIEKDINPDLVGGVQSFKKEVEDIKNVFKDLQKKERQREVNYKKQQAYLFEVERKWREMNGDYFPELKKKTNLPPPIASRVTIKDPKNANAVTPKDYAQILEELLALKSRHDEYHKRIDGLLQQKNKLIDQQSAIEENIKYSDKIIQALKLRLKQIRKIFKPTKKSLFGYDSRNNYEGTELQSEYNGGVDEIEREIQDQINQDKFDIKHLIANIPKPSRPKVVIEFEEKPGKGRIERKPSIAREISEQGGMIISGEKSEPKKWGSALTRVEDKGRHIRKEAVFDDSGHFTQEAKPLIIGINIWVNKNNAIMGMQAIYLNDDEIRYGTKSSVAADGFLQRYDLQSPDYLKNVTGAFSQEGYLEHLVLYSKQGKIGTFGFKNQGQEIFTFGLSSSERPFRIFGASFIFDSEPRLNRIGIEICPEA